MYKHEIDGFIRVRGGEFIYLVLFDHGLFDRFCDKIKYLISKKSGIADSINHNFGKIRIDSLITCPRNSICNFFNDKIFFRPIWSVTFCKNIFIFSYPNNITNFQLMMFFINFFTRVNICV